MPRVFALALFVVSGCHRSHDPASFAELFAGTKAPALSGPVLGTVQWGEPFAPAGDRLKSHAAGALTYFTVGDMASRLEEVVIQSSDPSEPEPELVKLWGPSALTVRGNGDVFHPNGSHVWYGDHVAALVHKADAWTISLTHYVPLAEQLGDPSKPLLGFEREVPLIGSTRADVERRYQDVLQSAAGGHANTLQLPNDELGSFHVLLRFDDHDVVRGLQFYVMMQKELAASRQALVSKRFDKTSLPGYEVHLITSEAPDEMWSVEIAAAR